MRGKTHGTADNAHTHQTHTHSSTHTHTHIQTKNVSAYLLHAARVEAHTNTTSGKEYAAATKTRRSRQTQQQTHTKTHTHTRTLSLACPGRLRLTYKRIWTSAVFGARLLLLHPPIGMNHPQPVEASRRVGADAAAARCRSQSDDILNAPPRRLASPQLALPRVCFAFLSLSLSLCLSLILFFRLDVSVLPVRLSFFFWS